MVYTTILTLWEMKDVPDPTAALGAALYVNGRPDWFFLPELNSSCATNCVYSAVTILNAGGVNTGGYYLLPQGLGHYFNP